MILDDDSFEIYAAKNYDIKRATAPEEFFDDLKRFQYLKRLFKRYKDSDDLKIRLIMNHIIILYNCFGKITTPMLFMRLEGYHHYIKPFCEHLNYMPDIIEYKDKKIFNTDIPMDVGITESLKKL